MQIAGVELGTVRSIRVQPRDANCPVSVEMMIISSYKLDIPRDSVVQAQMGGLLGQTFLGIDTAGASGPAVESGGVLPSRKTEKFGIEDFRRAVEALNPCKPGVNTADIDHSRDHRKSE